MNQPSIQRRTQSSQRFQRTTPGVASRLNSGIRFVFSFEAVFILFLFAGTFKEAPSFSFIPGDATVLFLLISGIAGLSIFCRKNRISIYVVQLIVLYFTFSLLCLASLVYTTAVSYGLEKTLRFIIITGWSFLGAVLLIDNETRRKRFLFLFIAFALFLSGGAVYDLFVQPDSYGGFLSSFSARYTTIGRITGSAFLICLGLLLFMEAKSKRLLIGISGLLLFFMTFASGGRAPVIAVGIPVSMLGVSTVRMGLNKMALRKWRRNSSPYIDIVILIGGILYGVQGGYFDLAMSRTLGEMEHLLDREGRSYLVKEAIDIWIEKPVLGAGIGGYAMGIGEGDVRAYPHSIFPEVLSELGMVGFLLMVMIVSYPVCLLKFKKVDVFQNAGGVSLFLVFVNTFINAMVAGDLNDNRLLFTWIGLFTAYVSNKRRMETRRDVLDQRFTRECD